MKWISGQYYIRFFILPTEWTVARKALCFNSIKAGYGVIMMMKNETTDPTHLLRYSGASLENKYLLKDNLGQDSNLDPFTW